MTRRILWCCNVPGNSFALYILYCPSRFTSNPTACVTCVWAGVNNAWEQEKLEATLREMLAIGAARCKAAVPHAHCTLCWAFFVAQDSLTEKRHHRKRIMFLEFSLDYLKPCIRYFHVLHNGTIQEISRFFVGGGKDECAAHIFKSS